MEKIALYHGDCIEVMDRLINENIKVNAVITDPPYQITKNNWDSIIPLDIMWDRINKITYKNSPIILTSDGLFTSKLIMSNEKKWRYNLIWDKVLPTGFLNANRMPLRVHETISIFYDSLPTYNPQKTKGDKNHDTGKHQSMINNNYGDFKKVTVDSSGLKYPKSIISIPKIRPSDIIHPTQKPIELMSYLIKTYTNKNDIILDFTMGSGTTALSCIDTNRRFIGIELNKEYYDIDKERVKKRFKYIENIQKSEICVDDW